MLPKEALSAPRKSKSFHYFVLKINFDYKFQEFSYNLLLGAPEPSQGWETLV